MDALRFLKSQHKEVDALLKEVDGLSDNAKATRKRLFAEIDQKLTIHAQIEETIFYPELKAAAARDKEAKQEVLEAYEEHANVKSMIQKLESTEPSDETYAAKLQVLSELVKHHVKEEEKTMFPQAKELLQKDQLEDLGARLEQATGELKSSKKKKGSRGPSDAAAVSELAR
ncbi:MAG: hemerythrin domain-containing protein [Candidatus Eremiobacteraeota bacterium]|nr:hemerythrin domain-containing protein [Candidatus Eremiobacteraeota bacterium]